MRRMPLQGGSTFGTTYLDRQLGHTFFGDTFVGFHYVSRKNIHVVKFLRAIRSEDMPQYILERKSLNALVHPSLELGRSVGYFCMRGNRMEVKKPYCESGSLAQRHPVGSIVPLDSVISYVDQIAPALMCAHQANIVHTNLKPENILINEDGQLLVSDFVLPLFMKRWLSAFKKEPEVPRTLWYSAPELLDGAWEPASDQYALAAMVYEWLCGRPPFQGTIQELLKHHRKTHPEPIDSVVDTVLRKALAKRPEDRFLHIEEFAQALRE